MDNNTSKRKDFIDIKGTLMGYARRWYWFVLSIAICLMGAYVYTKMFPQKSMVKSSILVGQDESTANMLSGLGGLFGADSYVQDEIFVISSHSVMKTVAQDLGLNKMHRVKTGFLSSTLDYPTFPVDVTGAHEIIDTLSATLTFKVEVDEGGKKADITVKAKGKKIAKVKNTELPATVDTDYGTFIVEKTEAYPGEEEVTTWINVTGYDSAGEELSENIQTFIASKKSNVIELSLETINDEYGCDLLNNVMKVYNDRGIEERNKRATRTADFIAERLELISAALDDAEQKIESYKEGNQLIDVATEASLNTRLKSQSEARLLEIQTKLEILRMTLSFLSQPEHKYDLMPVASGDIGAGETAVDAYNTIVLQRLEMLGTAKPNNRIILELEKQIDAMRANILLAIDRAIKANEVAEKDVQAQIDKATASLGNVPMQERQYINLRRQMEVKQNLYIFLLQKSEETAMLLANAIPKGQIIDQAYVLRDPVGLGKFGIAIIALILGLFIPILIFYLNNLLRSKVSSRSDIEKNTALPILGEMCTDKTGEKLVVLDESTSPAAEMFRLLRTNLQFVLGNPDEKVVMVTSTVSGEGKSFIAVNLAASLALLHRKVVLVGMDIRKPQLANYLGLPNTPGLTQYLSNHSMSVDDIIMPLKEVPGLDIIVAGPIPPNPGELMTSQRIGDIISILRDKYDYVILDTAPIGIISDSFNITRYVDATVFVMRNEVTRLQSINFLNEVAADGRLKRPNIVINGADKKAGYGYGYGYGYGSKKH
ncbi:MAG: polysaccharide biosynthesis tyrosine autokinase [Muribaculaceae bacterium]|nr:polysaccharide biosynthesis tyrosine autokinase [Muribaculaceae bacterium]